MTTYDDHAATAVELLAMDPVLAENLEAAQLYALFGIGHAVLAAAAELQRIRTELTALRLSQP
jgi:hypothetical protein